MLILRPCFFFFFFFFFCINFQFGSYNTSYYLETEKNLKVRSGDHIGISSLTFKNGKLLAESAIPDHLLFLNQDPSLDDFTTLSHLGDSKFLLEIEENLLIKRDKSVLKKHHFCFIICNWQGVIRLDNIHN